MELVKAARKWSAASFVNAVLRNIAKSRAEDPVAHIETSRDPIMLAQNAAHPSWLVERWIKQYGLETAQQICFHDQSIPDTAIHIHDDPIDDHQSDDAGPDAELAAAGIKLARGFLLTAARRLVAGDISATRAYQEGRISSQDEASQLVALLVGRGERLLDCCAAPGGKTALLALRNPRSKIVATELHPHRARLLQNLHRFTNVQIVAADARHLPFSACDFDRVLADVPCSGTGTLARNPEIKWRLKAEDLRDLQLRQVAILKSAMGHLASGGRLIYSTCSLEREENEAVVEAALDSMTKFNIIDLKGELQQIRQSGESCWEDIASLLAGPYLRTLPGVHPCDGFFAAMIERR